MITEAGYSKDPNIIPEGIVVTFGKEMIEEQGGLKNFLSFFEQVMNDEQDYWMHKCKNAPQYDILYVYVTVYNRLRYRCMFGGYFKENTTGGTADGREVEIAWPRIILSGPFEKCPFKRELKGFQGFRYCTKLF